MSRAKKFLEDLEKSGVANAAKRIRNLTQFSVQGNSRRPTTKTTEVLEPGVYHVGSDFSGVYFDVHEVNTDELLRFEDSRYNAILEEVQQFWEIKPKFQRLGYTNKRGVLLYGQPGTGKSCLIKLMMEDMVSEGNVVFVCKESYSLRAVLHQFREVESTRKALVVLEEVDNMSYHPLSEIFDGDDQIGDVLFVGTTNHYERIHPKMLREGRFDRKVEILPPPKEGRLEYLRRKLGIFEEVSAEMIESHAENTDGFTFGQLREFLIGVYCYDKPASVVIERIKKGGLDEAIQVIPTSEDELTKMLLDNFGYKRSIKNGTSVVESKPTSRARNFLNRVNS